MERYLFDLFRVAVSKLCCQMSVVVISWSRGVDSVCVLLFDVILY